MLSIVMMLALVANRLRHSGDEPAFQQVLRATDLLTTSVFQFHIPRLRYIGLGTLTTGNPGIQTIGT